jgi:hypothetical protein
MTGVCVTKLSYVRLFFEGGLVYRVVHCACSLSLQGELLGGSSMVEQFADGCAC